MNASDSPQSWQLANRKKASELYEKEKKLRSRRNNPLAPGTLIYDHQYIEETIKMHNEIENLRNEISNAVL